MSGNKIGPVGDWQREDVVEVLALKSTLGEGLWRFHTTQIVKVFLHERASVDWSICGFIHAILLLANLRVHSNGLQIWRLLNDVYRRYIKLESLFLKRVSDPRLNLISSLVHSQGQVLVLLQLNFEVGSWTCGHSVEVLLIAVQQTLQIGSVFSLGRVLVKHAAWETLKGKLFRNLLGFARSV